MKIAYRLATVKDASAIGLLHARSWQQHYRGVLSDSYLDEQVVADRLTVWQKRIENPASNQHIILAEAEEMVCGFVCLLFQEELKWGTLLDNLHVVSDWKGQGIGAALLKAGVEWSFQKNPLIPVHLWVFEANRQAIGFYEKLGGRMVERAIHDNPDGGHAPALRYVWENKAESLICFNY